MATVRLTEPNALTVANGDFNIMTTPNQTQTTRRGSESELKEACDLLAEGVLWLSYRGRAAWEEKVDAFLKRATPNINVDPNSK
jgi:hypothetical protein